MTYCDLFPRFLLKYLLSSPLPMIALPTTTARSMAPTGKSRFCVLTPKHSGKPYRSMHIISDARAVPNIEPLPPVDSVPPITTAVIIERVNVDPRSYLAESTFDVSSIPAIDAPIAVRIYVLMVITLVCIPEYSAACLLTPIRKICLPYLVLCRRNQQSIISTM